MPTISIWTDGGARGNPGPAGIGALIVEGTTDDQSILGQISQYIGETTNNQAEYRALQTALEWLEGYLSNQGTDPQTITLQLFTDSELMAYQVQGRYKVKNEGIKPLHQSIHQSLAVYQGFTITPVRREKNKITDRLVNQAIDAATLK